MLSLSERLFLRRCARQVRRCFTSSTKGASEIVRVGEHDMRMESGKLARFADGATVVTVGGTSALVTAVSSKSSSGSDGNYVPLMVDYRQKTAAAGRIPTNWFRRELGPSDREILVSRLIDRSLRPLFPSDFTQPTEITCNVLAVDGSCDTDIVCLNGAALSLLLSSIPWSGPVGAVRVVLDSQDNLHINPSLQSVPPDQRRLNMIVSGDHVISGLDQERVLMLEMSAQQIAPDELSLCVQTGLDHVQRICEAMQLLQLKIGKEKTLLEPGQDIPDELIEHLREHTTQQITSIFCDHSHDKVSRDTALSEFWDNFVENDQLCQQFLQQQRENVTSNRIREEYQRHTKNIYREMVLSGAQRCDGRATHEIRPMACEIGMYDALPGCAIFQRGQTQVLCSVAFDSPSAAYRTDLSSVLTGAPKQKQFMLHYDFPAYAINAVKTASPRRSIGHGALAEKAVVAVMPSLPFTTRVTSEVLESNGSSSMATVCAASMALMDAGVKLMKPVCGVALGLVSDVDQNKYEILTDLMGFEDYAGDMDFKIAGTRDGFTALQLDLKINGLPMSVFDEALLRATQAHRVILDKMDSVISEPRDTMKHGGPIIKDLSVPVHKTSQLVGPGAANLKFIQTPFVARQVKENALFQSEYGVELERQSDGSFRVFAPSSQAWQETNAYINQLLAAEREPTFEFGAIYTAKIVEILDGGVYVELYAGQTQPLFIANRLANTIQSHFSQLDTRKVSHASALGMKVGQEIRVKYYGRDPVSGKHRLSRKMLTMTAARQLNMFERRMGTTKATVTEPK